MTDREKRERLFFKYTQNLDLLVKHNLIKIPFQRNDNEYICPICLKPFPAKSLNQADKNPLTLEDVPPKALGGTANVLTCKNCNNMLGTKVDHHFIHRVKKVHQARFMPNTTFNGAITSKTGLKINGVINVKEDRTVQLLHDTNKAKPGTAEAFNRELVLSGSGLDSNLITFHYQGQESDPDLVRIAILKVAYLKMFECFGYLFLFNEVFRRVRNQLQSPGEVIFSDRNWIEASENRKCPDGVFFVEESRLNCLAVSFTAKLLKSESYFIAFIPLLLPMPYVIDELLFRHAPKAYPIEQLQKRFGHQFPDDKIAFKMKVLPYREKDFNDISKAKELLDWLKDYEASSSPKL